MRAHTHARLAEETQEENTHKARVRMKCPTRRGVRVVWAPETGARFPGVSVGTERPPELPPLIPRTWRRSPRWAQWNRTALTEHFPQPVIRSRLTPSRGAGRTRCSSPGPPGQGRLGLACETQGGRAGQRPPDSDPQNQVLAASAFVVVFRRG